MIALVWSKPSREEPCYRATLDGVICEVKRVTVRRGGTDRLWSRWRATVDERWIEDVATARRARAICREEIERGTKSAGSVEAPPVPNPHPKVADMASKVFALDDERANHGPIWAEGAEAERRRLIDHLIALTKRHNAAALVAGPKDREGDRALGASQALGALASELLESLK